LEVVMVILRISATYGAHPQSATKSYVTHNHTFADPAKAADFGTDWLLEEAVWFPIGAPKRGEHLINASFVMLALTQTKKAILCETESFSASTKTLHGDSNSCKGSAPERGLGFLSNHHSG